MKSRDCLVYVSTAQRDIIPSLFCEDRIYDVAINDYAGTGVCAAFRSELSYDAKGLKFQTIRANIADILSRPYEQFAFIDDDLIFDTKQANRLFQIGKQLELSLWQPAHTKESHNVHPSLYQKSDSLVRKADFVEVMCPFFSRNALLAVEPYLHLSESGWGLDVLWPYLLPARGVAIVDCETIVHTRPSGSGTHRTTKGITARDELNHIRKLITEDSWRSQRKGEHCER